MIDLSISEMLEMQQKLQQKYKAQWGELEPDAGRGQLLWMLGECGEVIDIIKKQGGAIAVPGEVREHFIEEMADVLMYFNDVLLCYGITAEELREIYIKKHEKNMTRW